ncbi:MAG: serine/threonine-protein phosphatase [Candidatus Curtissbacteria bacterium]|nr:serine/threonine-protein phosphatase [Candidatus Curtissbacteria bacterium]
MNPNRSNSPGEISFRYSGRSIPSIEHPDRNEDSIAYDPEGSWAAVLDGLGGTKAGKEASNKALEVIKLRLEGWKLEDDLKVEENLKTMVKKASLAVSRQVPDGLTTAVITKIVSLEGQKIFFISSVGDSRVYLFRKGTLIKITHDDSIVPNRIAQKLENATSADELSELEGKAFLLRSIVTQSVGQLEELEVHGYSVIAMIGDKLILTSDGIHDNLTFNEIEEVVGHSGDVAKLLVEAASKRSKENHFRSKPDDISAIVIEAY